MFADVVSDAALLGRLERDVAQYHAIDNVGIALEFLARNVQSYRMDMPDTEINCRLIGSSGTADSATTGNGTRHTPHFLRKRRQISLKPAVPINATLPSMQHDAEQSQPSIPLYLPLGLTLALVVDAPHRRSCDPSLSD